MLNEEDDELDWVVSRSERVRGEQMQNAKTSVMISKTTDMS